MFLTRMKVLLNFSISEQIFGSCCLLPVVTICQTQPNHLQIVRRQCCLGRTVVSAAEDTLQENESQSSSSTSSEIGENSIAGGQLGRKKRGIVGSGSILSNRGGVQALSRPATVDAEYEFLAIYMGLPERDRMAVGHDFEGMFKQCIFEGVDCLDERYNPCIIFRHEFLIPACFTFGQRPTMGTVSYSTPSS